MPEGRRKVWGDQKRAKHQNVVNIMTLHTDKDLKPNNLRGKILNQSRKFFGLRKAYFLWFTFFFLQLFKYERVEAFWTQLPELG